MIFPTNFFSPYYDVNRRITLPGLPDETAANGGHIHLSAYHHNLGHEFSLITTAEPSTDNVCIVCNEIVTQCIGDVCICALDYSKYRHCSSKDIGLKINALRTDVRRHRGAKLSQENFLKKYKLKICTSTFGHYETGRHKAKLTALEAISKALEVPMSYFFG
jgi:hypothetical protein